MLTVARRGAWSLRTRRRAELTSSRKNYTQQKQINQERRSDNHR